MCNLFYVNLRFPLYSKTEFISIMIASNCQLMKHRTTRYNTRDELFRIVYLQHSVTSTPKRIICTKSTLSTSTMLGVIVTVIGATHNNVITGE